MNNLLRSILLILILLFPFYISSASKTYHTVKYAVWLDPITVTASKIYSSDVILLAKLINAEAIGENYLGKLAVANVVFNRATINNESIKEIIYAPKQFCGVKTKRFKQHPPSECIRASYEILSGKRVLSSNTYYFLNPKTCNKAWKRKLSQKLNCKIGNHNFYDY